MAIDDTLAQALGALGTGFNLAEVHAPYAPLLAVQPTAAVRRSDNLCYGPHERQVLDVFKPQAGGSDSDGEGDGLKPVLAVVHGGGFVRGDKSAKAHLGWYFAGKGIVTVLPNYRLVPTKNPDLVSSSVGTNPAADLQRTPMRLTSITLACIASALVGSLAQEIGRAHV